jgi:hypothetical protein
MRGEDFRSDALRIKGFLHKKSAPQTAVTESGV